MNEGGEYRFASKKTILGKGSVGVVRMIQVEKVRRRENLVSLKPGLGLSPIHGGEKHLEGKKRGKGGAEFFF